MGQFFSSSVPEELDPRAPRYDIEASLERAAQAIVASGSMTAFTGAGISVESGIPDFRSPGGLWSKYDPFVYCEYNNFLRSPHQFWQMARELALQVHHANGGGEDISEGLKEAEPNAAHKALVALEREGLLSTVITQNIDSLHQRAGSGSVIEIHGTMATASCIQTGQQVEQSEILRQWAKFKKENPDARIETDGWTPRHPQTNGVLKADVTMFGEALPTGALARSIRAVLGSSVCLVVGTGLNVFPAAVVPGRVKWRFGTLIVLNMDDSGASQADIFLRGAAGELLPRLAEKVIRKRRG